MRISYFEISEELLKKRSLVQSDLKDEGFSLQVIFSLQVHLEDSIS